MLLFADEPALAAKRRAEEAEVERRAREQAEPEDARRGIGGLAAF